MSSECVCHKRKFCFYCEMYVPLEVKYEAMRLKLEANEREFMGQIGIYLTLKNINPKRAMERMARRAYRAVSWNHPSNEGGNDSESDD